MYDNFRALVAGMAPALASAAISKDDVYPTIDVVALDSVKEDAPYFSPILIPLHPPCCCVCDNPQRTVLGRTIRLSPIRDCVRTRGVPLHFVPERKLLICPCHWSSFDPAKAGQMVIGQGKSVASANFSAH